MSMSDYPGFDGPSNYDIEPACNCLKSGVDRIAAATESIALSLEQKLKGNCEGLDDCIDSIIEKLKKKLENGTKTCEQCKADVASGLGGTLEYAIACAGACIPKDEKPCYTPGEGNRKGKCTTCGKEPCCCKDGECVECPEEEKPKAFSAWCNNESGIIAVLAGDSESPGAGFSNVGMAQSEQEAIALAQSYCTKQAPAIIQPGRQSPALPSPFASPLCDIRNYRSESKIRSLLNPNGSSGLATSVLTLLNGITTGIVGGGEAGLLVNALNGTIGNILALPMQLLNISPPLVSAAVGCANETFNIALANLGVLGILEKQTGLDVGEFKTIHQYAMNALCRQKQISPNEAIAAYLSNAIDINLLDTHFAVAGLCPDSINWTIQSAKAKPVPQQLAMMRRRGIIDQALYANGMRQLGYLEEITSENIFKLSENFPSLSDIIRFMVRDADDDNLAKQLNLDAFFEQKYGAKLKQWSEYQGIPEDVAKYAWRSHWDIPSPGQLFTFYHRLRDNQQFGGRDKLLSDIKSALIQQDILPYWHEHYLATSFLPMGRIDIRRAFNIGALSEDELIPAFAQLGYSDETSAKLAKFSRRLRDKAALSHDAIKRWIKFGINRDQAIARMKDDDIPQEIIERALQESEQSFISSPYAVAFIHKLISLNDLKRALQDHGVSIDGIARITQILALRVTKHNAIKAFAVGMIDEAAARGRMLGDGMSPTIVDQLLIDANDAVSFALLVKCQSGIKRRFLLGELNAHEAHQELINNRTIANRADQMIDSWQCELKSRGKHVSAQKLCDWLGKGVINSGDFLARLKRIGYSENDAAIMLEDCLGSIDVKRLKEAQKFAKNEALQTQKAAQLAARNSALQQKNLEKLAAGREKQARAKIAREKQLLSAMSKVSKKCKCEVTEVSEVVRFQLNRLQSEFALNVDESLQVLILSSEAWVGTDLQDYELAVSEFALSLLDGKLPQQAQAPSQSHSSNGLTQP